MKLRYCGLHGYLTRSQQNTCGENTSACARGLLSQWRGGAAGQGYLVERVTPQDVEQRPYADNSSKHKVTKFAILGLFHHVYLPLFAYFVVSSRTKACF
jgi:hypothetical protein